MYLHVCVCEYACENEYVCICVRAIMFVCVRLFLCAYV